MSDRVKGGLSTCLSGRRTAFAYTGGGVASFPRREGEKPVLGTSERTRIIERWSEGSTSRLIERSTQQQRLYGNRNRRRSEGGVEGKRALGGARCPECTPGIAPGGEGSACVSVNGWF